MTNSRGTTAPDESWYRAVTRSAAQIRRRFGVPDQATEERMVRAFRAALRPRRKAGRKPDEATARAAEMWTAGMEHAGSRRYQRVLWQRIYRAVFPRLRRRDRLFWVVLRALWSDWSDALILVKPATVLRWHRAGFRFYWRFRSRCRPGRRRLAVEIYDSVQRISRENPSWGAPRIHAELQLLGFDVSERTVLRYMSRSTRPPSPENAQSWQTFLRNHREALAAMDFFSVPTVTFRLLYCLFIIDHQRRRILHFAVTAHPTAAWVCQQLRESFPYSHPYRHLILDRDTKFSPVVLDLANSMGLDPVRTMVRSPWQNGTAERWVGTCRRECFDHVIAIDEPHVRRIAREFLSYYHDDRPHDALAKQTPASRPVQPKPSASAALIAEPRVGGLHYRYSWKDVA